MTQSSHVRRKPLRTGKLTDKLPNRLREIAEAGANGRELSPVEVIEVCEALRQQKPAIPTRFHSSVG